MTIGFIFWLIFLIALILGCVPAWRNDSRFVWGSGLLLAVLLFLLGVGVFGWPIRG